MNDNQYLGLVFDQIFKWGTSGNIHELFFYRSGCSEINKSHTSRDSEGVCSELIPFLNIVLNGDYHNMTILFGKKPCMLLTINESKLICIHNDASEPIKEKFLEIMDVK